MDQETRSNIAQIKQTKEFSQCLRSIDALISLLKNERFWAEYSLLKKMTPKIAIRLRNSPYSRSLEQLLKVFTDFKNSIEPASPFDDMKLFLESDIANVKLDKLQTTVNEFKNQQQSLAQKLFLMATLSQKAFRLSQVWLELGQLVNHFLMVSCVASRICVFSKALLVYLYDVYQVTNKLQETAEIFNLTDQHADTVCDRLKPLLQKLNIKLRVSSKPNKLPNDTAKTTKPSKAISKSALLKDDKEVEVSVDLGVPLQRDVKQNKKKPLPKKKNSKKKKAKKQSGQ